MKIIFGIALIFNILLSQPESRFEAFDWILYRQTGSISSISEGFDYAYFGTDNAGILRLQLYQDRFDVPITTAQGLSDNKILAVHFDKNTGMIWVASENFIDYSYNAEGNWFHIDLNETGLHCKAIIQQIGSSNNYIWINAGSAFLKLDKVSGIVIGLLPLPDEDEIIWSSKKEYFLEIPVILKNYVVMDGWIINYNQFADPFGKIVEPTTVYFGKNSEVYIGMIDGTIFKGDVQMETFYPFHFGLNNTDITAFTKNEDLWIVGRNAFNSEGITKFSFRNNEFQHIDFENEINFNSNSFFSVIEIDRETWIGGNSIISIYNKEKDYWREISKANGLPNGIITSMVEDSSSIWVGSTRGLVKISKINKHVEQIDFENILELHKINDLDIIYGNLWIATEEFLLIYDLNKNILFDFKEFGNTNNIDKRKDVFIRFTDIYHNNNEICISTSVGILKYNTQNNEWAVLMEPSAYAGSNVNSLVITNGYCFIGTSSGLWQINIEDGNSIIYDYPFIGSVQDMYIHDEILLIGSNKGLIKYFWKKNI